MSNEKADDALAFLGRLASGLAHEIRNPLNTLSVNLQLLKEDWKNPQTPKEQRTKSRILLLLKETNRLEEILNDFLRFAGKHKLNLENHDMVAVVEDVLEFVGPELTQKKIRLHKYFSPQLPKCNIDVNLIKQALLNIIINAQQAMPEGGELIIRATRNGDMLSIEITDTGTGIEPEILPRIFDVYFSARKSGTGLGLPTARRIINEHGGSISVRSELGKGSSFTLTIPVSPHNTESK